MLSKGECEIISSNQRLIDERERDYLIRSKEVKLNPYKQEIKNLKSNSEALQFEISAIQQASNKMISELNIVIVQNDKQVKRIEKQIKEIENHYKGLLERLKYNALWQREIYGI